MSRKIYRLIALILCLGICMTQAAFATVQGEDDPAQTAEGVIEDDNALADTALADIYLKNAEEDMGPDQIYDREENTAGESDNYPNMETYDEEYSGSEGKTNIEKTGDKEPGTDHVYNDRHAKEDEDETNTEDEEDAYKDAETESEGSFYEADDNIEEGGLDPVTESCSEPGADLYGSERNEAAEKDNSEIDPGYGHAAEDRQDIRETSDDQSVRNLNEEKDNTAVQKTAEEYSAQDVNEAETDLQVQTDQEINDIKNIPESVKGIDFSPKRLIVGNPDMILSEETVIFESDDLFLMQFSSEEETRQAYIFYRDHSEFVDIDAPVAAADETISSIEKISAADKESFMTPEDNPFSLMQDVIIQDKLDNEESTLNRSKSESGCTIALLDTGVSEGQNIEARYSVCGEYVGDDNGHGDKIAKIITKINPDIKIISVKVLDENGVGSVSSVYAGIRMAIAEGADMINMSFYGLKNPDISSLQEISGEALDKGIIITGAAGNSGRNADHYFPGCLEEAVIAGSIDAQGHICSFSNYGDNVDYYAVSDSTSEACAIICGYISTGKSEKELLEKGYFFLKPDTADYHGVTDSETDDQGTEETTFYAAVTAGTTAFGEAIPFKYGVGYFTKKNEADTQYGDYLKNLPWQNLISAAGSEDYYRMKIGEIYSRREAVSKGSWFKWKNNGFIFKDDKTVPIDTKVYIWAENTQYGYALRDNGHIGQPQASLELPYSQRDDADIMLEFHFYEAGTDKELSEVYGFMWLCDLDYKDSENVRSRGWREGYTIVTGAKKYYTSVNSDLITMKDEDGNTAFYGSEDTTADNIDSTLGVCFESTPSAPLLVRYHARALYWQCFGDDGQVKINYHIKNIPEGKTLADLLPNTKKLIINTRTSGKEADFYWDHTDVPNYTFKGWYIKSDLTGSPYKGTDKMTADVDLYGTYIPDPGTLSLKKSIDDRNGYDFIKDNKCYSLKGAEYGVYSSKSDAKDDKNRLDILTTDASGKTSKSKSLEPGTYYIRELTASTGFLLCRGKSGDDADKDGIHTVKIEPGKSSAVTCKETPAVFMPSISLRKLDAITGSDQPSGIGSLKDAVFELDYYDNLKGQKAGDPALTWTFKTGKTGILSIKDKELPIGTYVLKETVPSKYYKLEGEICFSDDKEKKHKISDGLMFIALVNEKGTGLAVKQDGSRITGTEFAVEAYEQPYKGKVTVIKKDGKTDKPLPGIIFRLKSKDGKQVYEQTTGNDGSCEFDGLATGQYVLTETASDKSHQLLKDNIDINLPIEMSEEQVDKNKADRKKAVWDENSKMFCFYEQVVTVSDGVDFEVPMTGGSSKPLYAGAAIAALMIISGLVIRSKIFA